MTIITHFEIKRLKKYQLAKMLPFKIAQYTNQLSIILILQHLLHILLLKIWQILTNRFIN